MIIKGRLLRIKRWNSKTGKYEVISPDEASTQEVEEAKRSGNITYIKDLKKPDTMITTRKKYKDE